MKLRRPRRCSPAMLSLRPGDLGMVRVGSKQSGGLGDLWGSATTRDGCATAEWGHRSSAASRVHLGVPPASASRRTAASVPEGASR
jgi:hypothetical protein